MTDPESDTQIDARPAEPVTEVRPAARAVAPAEAAATAEAAEAPGRAEAPHPAAHGLDPLGGRPVAGALVPSSRPSPAAAAPTAKTAAPAMARDARGFPIGPYTFGQEEQFAGNVGRSVLGASVGGLVAFALAAGGTPPLALAVSLGMVGALAAVGAKSGGLWRAVQSAALGLVGGWLYSRSLEWPLLGALFLGAAAAPVLARGETTEKLALTGAVTGLLALAGAYVSGVLLSHGEVLGSLVPAPLATAAASGAFGLFLGLGAAPRHVHRSEEPVEAAYSAALGEASGEVHEILERSLAIYRMIRADLGSRAGSKTEVQLGTRVSDLAMRILVIGKQCRAIEADLGAAPAKALEDRIEALRKKADATSDPSARATFLATIDSLDAQKKAVEAIGRGLERVLARLHANVALLEKVRFSLVHARSADAERSGSEASPLTDTIDELSRELDATSTAVGEVYGRVEAV